jgi:hypothetical protein
MVQKNDKFEDDENKIRDHYLFNYLNDNIIRKQVGLMNFYFDREIDYKKTKGRVDIRVITSDSFINTDICYIFECKRLDGLAANRKSSLNGRYIKEGIDRFISNTYPTYTSLNGMIGFLVQKVNIDDNVTCINNLLSELLPSINISSNLSPSSNYEELYYSNFVDIQSKQFTLYHLFFDLSQNIKAKR